MKKIYFLLSVTHVVLTSCMEMERHKPYHRNNEAEVPLNNVSTNIPAFVPVYIEALQTGWQQLNDIANMTYQNVHQTITNTIADLQPVYLPMDRENQKRTTHKPLETAEKKVSLPIPLKTNEPDPALMQELYKKAQDLYNCPCSHSGGSIFAPYHPKKLITFIATMNDAKNKNITEDIMMKFAYDQWNHIFMPEGFPECIVSIALFGHLKCYNTMSKNKKENLPNINDFCEKEMNNEIAHILHLQSNLSKTICDDSADKYPLFNQLRRSRYTFSNTLDFLDFIYLYNPTPRNVAAQLSYTDLKDKLYHEAYALLCGDPCDGYRCRDCFTECRYHSLSVIISLIDKGKTLHPKKLEYDFGYDISTSPQSTITKAFASINLDFHFNVRQRIAIICSLIQQYNDQRKTKKTPISGQYFAYANHLPAFAYPDNFDGSLFDKEKYALNEYAELFQNIRKLQKSTDQHILECINQLYPPRK